jgi:hypothetical protein
MKKEKNHYINFINIKLNYALKTNTHLVCMYIQSYNHLDFHVHLICKMLYLTNVKYDSTSQLITFHRNQREPKLEYIRFLR